MRVLLVANTLPPQDISGAGEQVVQLAAGLARQGHTVRILGREPGGAFGPKVLFPLTVLPATWRALRRERPEIVQVHESDGALAALLVAVVGRFFNPRPRLVSLLQVSYCEEIRAVRPLRYQGRVLGRPGGVEQRFRFVKAPVQVLFGWLTAQLSELIFAPSEATAREIEKDYRVRGVRMLPNVTGGLPIPIPSPSALEDLPSGYLLYVGRLRIRKGVEVLLEALQTVRRTHPAVRLLIAGAGEHQPALAARAAALELGESVRFLGRCDAGRVRRLLSGARALVVPSTYEGMPLVILEAMEAGVPVVASRVSGIPEVVVDGRTGWLVPPEDPPALAAALAALLDDAAEAGRRGAAGQQRVRQEYTPEVAAARWTAVVEEALLAGAVLEGSAR